MEFVRVIFPESRGVQVDGILTGTTNKTFMLQAGTYRFSLAGLMNYLPPSMTAQISGTTPLTPATLTFTPVFADLAVEAAATSPARRRRAGGGATGKTKKRKPAKKSSKKKSSSAKKPSAKKPSAKGKSAKTKSSKKRSRK